MDPQKLASLDPKLREAYQRVMGTPIPQMQPASTTDEPIQTQTPPMPTPPPMPDPNSTPAPQPQPEPESINQPTPPAQPPMPEPPPPPPAIQPEPVSEPAIQPEPPPAGGPTPEPAIPTPPSQANNFVQMNSEVPTAPTTLATENFSAPAPQAQTAAIKKKGGVMTPVLFGIVGLIFIVIYTLFWTKIFNFKLPFL